MKVINVNNMENFLFYNKKIIIRNKPIKIINY